jgi:RimJ/RimL family protein N-acetyltransferase
VSGLKPFDRELALKLIREQPTHVEFRSIALDPAGELFHSGRGLLLADAHSRLLGALGEVESRDVERLVTDRRLDCELLADAVARQALPRYQFTRALVFTLGGAWQPVAGPAGLTVRQLAASDSIAHLETELAEEIELERRLGSVLCGFFGQTAVGFAYARKSDALADISIDTVAEYRRRGVAAAVASALVEAVLADGLAPVWGAVEHNEPSLGLAEKLGFTRFEGELFVCECGES